MIAIRRDMGIRRRELRIIVDCKDICASISRPTSSAAYNRLASHRRLVHAALMFSAYAHCGLQWAPTSVSSNNECAVREPNRTRAMFRKGHVCLPMRHFCIICSRSFPTLSRCSHSVLPRHIPDTFDTFDTFQDICHLFQHAGPFSLACICVNGISDVHVSGARESYQ